MGSQLTRENSELGWELIKSLFDHILAMIGNIQSWFKSDGRVGKMEELVPQTKSEK